MDFKFKSLIELVRYFKDEKVCNDFLEQQIWVDGKAACPHCGSLHVYTRKNRSKKLAELGVPEYKCAEKGCSQNFTAKVGTIFESSKLPLQTWFAAIWLATTTSKGISSNNLAKQLGITQKSAWFVLSRIRTMFKQTAPDMLEGIVECDETYVGGKYKNIHASKKQKANTKYGRSHNNDNKTPVFGLLQRDGKVFTYAVPNAQADTLSPIMVSHVAPSATLITDDHKSYKEVGKSFNHIMVKTKPNSYVTDHHFHTNNIEGYWSQLKRGIIGVYHQVSPKHLQLYCNEYSYRYNARKDDSVNKFADAIGLVIKARVTYKELIKK